MQNNSTSFLNYRISGNGDPVLFLHGFMEDSSMWEPLIDHLPVKAILIDLPGHGKSEISTHHPSIESIANDVMNIVHKENIQDAQIVGHSLGGYVALELMKKNELFEHVTLFHSHPWEDAPTKKEDRNRVIDLVKEKASFFIREAIPNLFWEKSLQQTIDHYISIASQMNPSAIAWAAAAMRDRPNNEAIICKHPTKFTLIQGQFDALIPKSATSEFCKKNAINYIEIKNCGHMAHEEQTSNCLEIFKTILLD
jgi:pimeloyl-ACP methyl ester carboxylesterase